MDVETLLSIGRILERLTIVVVAALMARTGASLLSGFEKGESTIDFKSALGKLKITKTSTGVVIVFVSLFVLIYALFSSLKLDDRTERKETITSKVSDSTKRMKKDFVTESGKSQQTETIKTETNKERKVQFHDAPAADYVGPKATLPELQKLYSLAFQCYRDKYVPENIRTGLFNLYQQLYELNKLTQQDKEILSKLNGKTGLTEEERSQKKKLENNKLSEEYDPIRIQQ